MSGLKTGKPVEKDQAVSPTSHRMAHVFRALSHRNFRLFISGQLLSLIGTWMQQMAMSWMVYRLTHSPVSLGLIAFSSQGPGFFIAPFAGSLADRYNRRNLLFVTQALAMLQAFTLAFLSLKGLVEIWHLFALSIFMGIVTGVDIPVRQSLMGDLVDKPEDLSNAISLNSSVFNATRLIGPAIAGLTIAALGEGLCFLLNGLSFIAVLVALSFIQLKPKPPVSSQDGYFRSIAVGVAYAYNMPAMRAILSLLVLVSLVGLPYSVLIPVYAKDVFQGGPQTLGLLMGATGMGALCGAIYLASRRNVLGLGRLIPIAASGFGLSLIAFAFCHELWLALILLFLLGLSMMLHLASSNILLQTLADNQMRGRVMSLYTMAFLGMTPFGSLLIGFLGRHIGVSITLMLGGSLCLSGAILFALKLPLLRESVRPIYIKKGILRETVSGKS